MQKLLLAAASLAFCCPAHADPKWSYEFEFTYAIPTTSSLLFYPACNNVVPVELVKWYAADPRPGWEISCGNKQPMYTHWLGRQIGHPLPNLTFEIGWRHLSSPLDQNEVEFDSIGIRGRFAFGKQE